MSRFDTCNELKQRFGSDFKIAYRVIFARYVLMFIAILLLFVGIYFSIELDWFYFYISLLVLDMCIDWYGEKKLSMTVRLKDSSFKKRIDRPIRILFVLLILAAGAMAAMGYTKDSEEFKTKPIHEAVKDLWI
jgi:hypothetical protein